MNRFDSPAQDKYFNTYVPLPYEQVMGTVAARQAQLQRDQDMLNKTYEDTQNLKYIPGTKDEQYVRDYLGKTGNIVNKYYGSDLSDPIVKQQMRQEFNAITNKPDLQNIQASHAAWLTNQKYKAELKAQGLYDPAIDEEPANANWDTVNGNGIYNNITSPYKNPRPAAETYFNNIKPSDLPTEGDYLMEGIGRNKIDQVINTKWNEFANTSEGSLYVKKIAKENGLDYTNPEVKKQIATDYLKGVGEEYIYKNKNGATLDAQTRAAQAKKTGSGSDQGPIDREWFVRKGAENQAADARSDKAAIAAEGKQYDQNVTELAAVKAQMDLLKKNNVEGQNIEYKNLSDARTKLENNIIKYKDTEEKINKETRAIMVQSSEISKNKFVSKLATTLGVSPTDSTGLSEIKTLLDKDQTIVMGKNVRNIGFKASAAGVSGVANSVALLPYVAQVVVNKVNQGIDKLGILSKADQSQLVQSVRKVADEAQLSDNPTFGEIASAAYKTVRDYTKARKVTWGKDVKDAIINRSFVNQMKDLDNELTGIKSEEYAAREQAKANVYNYNVSDVLVKPLNYTNKSGRVSIISQAGDEYLSQMNNFYGAVKTNPGSYKVKDVSDGNRIKEGNNFNTEFQKIAASYEPLPGSVTPRIDKDGNLHVQLAYQNSKPSSGSDAIKKFEVSIDDPQTINALAQDYYASGYYDSYSRLSNLGIHKDVEIYANSKEGHEYDLVTPSKDGKKYEHVSVVGKRVGSEYIIESSKNPGQPAREYGEDGIYRELKFGTKEEFENWLYSKQTSLLFGSK